MTKSKLKDSCFSKISFSLGIYVSVCIIGIGMAFYPSFISGFSSMQNDVGDTRLNNYFLEHSFQVLFNKDYVGGLWSPPFFYPYKQVLAFSDNLFGSAPIYWFFRAFLSSDIAFTFWMITASILNFVSFAFLLKQFKINPFLIALGSFIFAFGMPRIAQLGHQQLLPQFFTPLVFWIMWNFVKRPQRKSLIMLLILVYLQVLAGIYLGWFLLFSLVIFLGVTYSLSSQYLTKFITYCKSDSKSIVAITVSWVSLMIITLLPYLKAKSVLGSKSYSEVDTMLPRLASWFSAPPGSLWSPLLKWVSQDLPWVHEHYMFAGLTVILLTGLSVYTVIFWKNSLNPEKLLLVKSCLLVFLIIFCLSLRLPFGLSLWRIIYEIVPGASVIRAVTRIWTISYFYLLVAMTVCMDFLVRAKISNQQWRWLAVSVLCLIGIAEQIIFGLPAYEKAPLKQETTEISELIKGCNIAYLSLNPTIPFYIDHLSAMWAGIEANVPVINGYSGNVPPDYGNDPKSTAQVVHWLDSVGDNSSSKLCIISRQPLDKKDHLISKYTIQKNISFSGNFISYLINLPIDKTFSQEIKLFDFPDTVETNSVIKLPVIVKNTSNFLWSPKGDHPTNFSYRWLDANNKLVVFDGDGDRTVLPWELEPGDSVALNAFIKTPGTSGKYQLILTMVKEKVAWFSERETESTKVNVTVVSP
jgi:hypothetical protein